MKQAGSHCCKLPLKATEEEEVNVSLAAAAASENSVDAAAGAKY